MTIDLTGQPASRPPAEPATPGPDFVGRGWKLPMGVTANGSVATVGGRANLEKAMQVVLRTYLGERPMRPAFGSRLRDFLFDGVTDDNATAIATEVRRALESCEPRAVVDDVQVTPSDGPTGRFDIEIFYSIRGSNDEHNLVVPFYTIPGEE
jgi:uncharacterized protein